MALSRDDMGLAAGSVAIAAVAVAVWVGSPQLHPPPAAAEPVAGGATLAPAAQPAPSVTPAAPAAPATLAAAAPLMRADQWQTLQARLANHPQRDAETARIVSLLGFQQAVAQWRAAQQREPGSPAVALQARALAAQTLPRLQAAELTGPEALALQAALIAAYEPQPGAQALALAQWRDAATAAVAQAGDPRDAAYLAAQAERVAAWRSLHPDTPPDAALVAELDALRRQHYASTPTP